MARELLRPEDATNWDDFLERIALERAARSARQPFLTAPWGFLVISLLVISYAAAWEGPWWLWVAAFIPLVLVFRMIVKAAGRADADRERLKELDQLELGWKSHLEHCR